MDGSQSDVEPWLVHEGCNFDGTVMALMSEEVVAAGRQKRCWTCTQYLVLKTPLLDIPSLQYHYAFRKELVRPVGFWGLSTSGLYG